MVRTWVSIALFFLLSAFFLFALLAALHRSRKAISVASVCLIGAVCIIVFLTPVRWPSWLPPISDRDGYHRYTGGTDTTEPGDPDSGETTPESTPQTVPDTAPDTAPMTTITTEGAIL